ncbi:hypothetical protein QWJ90_00080 [Microbacterium oryzae]|nr:hypothetical protein [Microbacterium oryzae]MDN3309324.1 hypothetical protein [Microbacterium oryzae]
MYSGPFSFDDLSALNAARGVVDELFATTDELAAAPTAAAICAASP